MVAFQNQLFQPDSRFQRFDLRRWWNFSPVEVPGPSQEAGGDVKDAGALGEQGLGESDERRRFGVDPRLAAGRSDAIYSGKLAVLAKPRIPRLYPVNLILNRRRTRPRSLRPRALDQNPAVRRHSVKGVRVALHVRRLEGRRGPGERVVAQRLPKIKMRRGPGQPGHRQFSSPA